MGVSKTKKYWNSVSLGYVAKRNESNSVNEMNEFPALKGLINEVKNKKVLDVGCAFGTYSVWAKKQGAAEVIGVDLSDKMIDLANQYARSQDVSDIKFQVKDASDLSEYADGYFDLIICSMTIGFFDNLEKYFREFNRVLKKGGKFIFSEIHPFRSAGKFLKNKNDEEIIEIEDYLTVRKSELESPWKDEKGRGVSVTVWHRTIENLISTLHKTKFSIQNILEPLPQKKMADINLKRYKRDIRIPVFLIVESTKI